MFLIDTPDEGTRLGMVRKSSEAKVLYLLAKSGSSVQHSVSHGNAGGCLLRYGELANGPYVCRYSTIYM